MSDGLLAGRVGLKQPLSVDVDEFLFECVF